MVSVFLCGKCVAQPPGHREEFVEKLWEKVSKSFRFPDGLQTLYYYSHTLFVFDVDFYVGCYVISSDMKARPPHPKKAFTVN
jgi:hypothetical protein